MTQPTYDGFGDGWITSSADPRLITLWPGSDDYEDDLDFVLWCAKIQCERFAPALTEGQSAPENYVAAQCLQARALIRAGVVGDGDRTGMGPEQVAVFPMDWTVKNLLRPRRGRPGIG